MRKDQERERLLWALQSIREHLYKIAAALQNATVRVEHIRIIVEKWTPFIESIEERPE